jgi:hypothetical protein
VKLGGNNLHLVLDTKGEQFLCSMPKRLRNVLLVYPHYYFIVERISEGKKVKAEIQKVILPPHINEIKEAGLW